MNKRIEVLKVHPDFHKKIKRKAVENDMTIIEYTERLCDNDEALDLGCVRKRGKDGFKLKF